MGKKPSKTPHKARGRAGEGMSMGLTFKAVLGQSNSELINQSEMILPLEAGLSSFKNGKRLIAMGYDGLSFDF